ncbi:MAG: hypothetical protein ACYSU1_02200 [Planctomycetota bacterium]|jgi:hypothetical protein
MKHATRLSLLVGSFTLVAASCGSDTDVSGDIVGLSMPDAMDLVGIDEETAGSAVAPGASINPAVTFGAATDYNTDEVHAYMWDETTESLNIINEILTAVGQTRAPEFVNTGPYIALVEVIDGDEADDGASGQSSSGNATELEPWIINSTRASTTAAQVVRFWISSEEEMGPGTPIESTIYGRATVSEEPTASNPYGDFRLDFGFLDDSDASLLQRGSLQTTSGSGGNLGFTFMMEDVAGLFGDDTQVAVETDAAQTTGTAHMLVPNWSGGSPIEYSIAYNQNYFLRSDGTDTVLLDRNDFVRNIWGYNLYHAEDGNGFSAGDRVDMQGGFSFLFDNGGSTDYGWVDYWGIWTEDASALPDGATVTKEDSTGTAQTYEVVRAPGKLVKVTKRSITLAELDGEAFEYWDWTSGDQFLVEYTHGTTTFTKVALRDQENWEWNDLGSPVVLTINPDEYYGFWSEALGGSLDFVGGASEMTVREEEFVSGDDSIFGGDTSLTLYAMVEPLRAGMTANQVNTGDIFMTEVTDPNLAYEYTFQQDGRVLEYLGANVGLLPNAIPDSGFYLWGMRSGPMSATDPVTLGVTDPWEMYNLDEYFYYETGHNDWNQYATLIDSDGDPVQFDSPISFFYTHATANDADDSADHDGSKVFLSYGGDRNLWGIPGVDADTDGDGFGDRWYPLFSLKDGTVMGPTGTEYVVKAVDMELYMTVSGDAIPPALQTALNGAGSLTLPSLTDWNDPTGVSAPVVTDEPAVVAGVIQ